MENKTNLHQELPQGVVDAKAKGQSVFAFETESGAKFFLRAPSKIEIIKWQDDVAKGGSPILSVQEKMLRSLFVGDNTAEFDAYLNSHPLAYGKIFDLIVDDLGLKENFTKTQV